MSGDLLTRSLFEGKNNNSKPENDVSDSEIKTVAKITRRQLEQSSPRSRTMRRSLQCARPDTDHSAVWNARGFQKDDFLRCHRCSLSRVLSCRSQSLAKLDCNTTTRSKTCSGGKDGVCDHCIYCKCHESIVKSPCCVNVFLSWSTSTMRPTRNSDGDNPTGTTVMEKSVGDKDRS